MKILYHHRTQGRWAEGVHIREVVNAMRALGHEVVLVSPPGIDPFAEELLTGQRRQSVLDRLHEWASDNLPQILFEALELGYFLIAFVRISRMLARGKFDLIYERYAFFSSAGAAIASRRYDLPMVLEVNEISGIERERRQVLVRWATSIERIVVERAIVVVTVSSFLKEQIAMQCGDASKIVVSPNAVNLDDFRPEIDVSDLRVELALQGKIVIGFVGAFCIWDRLEFLLEVFANLIGDYPDLQLLLVGDGPNTPELKGRAQRMGLGGRVIFTGRVPRGAVPAHIALMDIGVLPHSNPFGSPVVLFELMAMAKPVVAAGFGPIAEVISDGNNGLLFEPGIHEDFEQRLRALIGDPVRRATLGIEARRSVESTYFWGRNVERVLAQYAARRI